MVDLMYRVVAETISDEVYKNFLDYMLLRCDIFTLCLPNLYKLVVNEKTAKFLPKNINTQAEHILEMEKHYNDYIKQIQPAINKLQKFLLFHYFDTSYNGIEKSYEMDINVYKVDQESIEVLKAQNSILDWQYPNTMEDLCFFYKGHCFMQTIAHDYYCVIFLNEKYDLSILRKIGVKLYKMNKKFVHTTPCFNYSVQY